MFFVPINERASGKRHEHMLASGLLLQLCTREVTDMKPRKKRVREGDVRLRNFVKMHLIKDRTITVIKKHKQTIWRVSRLTKTSMSMCSSVTSKSSSRAARVIVQLIQKNVTIKINFQSRPKQPFFFFSVVRFKFEILKDDLKGSS